jgi:long-chain-fatty-acid---luciferin-component ligase
MTSLSDQAAVKISRHGADAPHANVSGTVALAETIDPIDRLLSSQGVYRLAPGEVDHLRVEQITRSLLWHVEANLPYRNYCESLNFDPRNINGIEDLTKVPLLPSSIFKRRHLSVETVGCNGGSPDIFPTTSSGTQGSISIIPRDDLTLMRFFASVSVGVREILGVDDFSMTACNLGPSPEEAKNLWVSYVLAGASVFFDSANYVVDGVFCRGQLISDLQTADGPVIVGGPPGLIIEMCGAGQNLPLERDSLVVTVGGWKRATGGVVDRETFRAMCATTFDLAADRVRDTFNMVELNTVLFECAHGAKHVPPWLHVSARDPRTLQPVANGQAGILAYLDPTAQSYPAFILSDDFGWVLQRHACGCGLQTDTLTLDRRINRIEARGCALKMDYSASDRTAAK